MRACYSVQTRPQSQENNKKDHGTGVFATAICGALLQNNNNYHPNMVSQYPAMRRLFAYVRATWVQRGCRFSPITWNVHKREMDRRSNNAVESYNNRWNRLIGNRHPSLWTFIRILKDEQRIHERRVEQMYNGVMAPIRRLKWRRTEEKLKKLTQQFYYGERTLEMYWRVVTHLVNDH